MKLIQVTDDQGALQFINPAFVLSVKARVRSDLGSVIRFSNGTTLNVIEGVQEMVCLLRSV